MNRSKNCGLGVWRDCISIRDAKMLLHQCKTVHHSASIRMIFAIFHHSISHQPYNSVHQDDTLHQRIASYYGCICLRLQSIALILAEQLCAQVTRMQTSGAVMRILSFSDISIVCCIHIYYTFLIVCCILHIIMLHFSELLYQIIIMHYLLHCVWWCIPLLGAFHYLMGAGHCITWPVTLTGGLHYLMGCITGRCKALLDGLHYLVHWPVQE